MITKIAYGFLIFSFLGYTGCYQTSLLTQEDLDEHVSKKIDVFTVDAKHYQFDERCYRIHADTLRGKGIELTGEDSTVFVGTIPVNIIKKVELRSSNYKAAVGLCVLGLVAVVVIVVSNAEVPSPGFGYIW